MVRSEDVKKVYCLVRATSPADARNRVMKSLHFRRLYIGLSAVARQKIICLPSDLSLSSLGLDKNVFGQIAREVTNLYHCAWNVNFNLRLSSFERDCIAGLKNLIDLCLESHGDRPATFNFFSSIGTVSRTQDEIVPEALPTKFSNAQPTGYGESKLVAEHLCMKAAAQTGIPVYVLRIGQIIGDNDHGIWNSTEAIPLMMRTAATINALPSIDEDLRWTAVDDVARSAIEISNSGAATGIFNLINPHTINWNRDMLPYLQQAGLKFDICDPSTWLERLQAASDPVANPPVKLLEHFKRRFNSSEGPRTVEFETKKAQRWSETFSTVKAPSQDLITKMIQHFTRTSWTSPSQEEQLRPIIAFSGSRSIQVSGSESVTVDSVASLVSTQLGIPISDASTLGFNKTSNGTSSLELNGKAKTPAIVIVDGKDIQNIPAHKTRFLVITNGDDIESSRIETDENIDMVSLDTSASATSLIDEAVFWARDLLHP